MIVTDPPLVAVAVGVADGGGLVTEGTTVSVAVGTTWVAVSVIVAVGGRGVKVGNGVGGTSVGNGVNVTGPKLNKGVGVAPPPWLGRTTGLGVIAEELRGESKLIVTEQRKQSTSKNKPGITILPTHPCWLYVFISVERNVLISFIKLFDSAVTDKTISSILPSHLQTDLVGLWFPTYCF